jgi:diguanylate cyclase (GGDEF)-like protein
VRGSDVAARLGGDEFVIVYEGLQDGAAFERASGRVHRALAAAIEVDADLTLEVTASIGSVLASSEDAWDELIERADLDMYRIKHLARGDMQVTTPLRPRIPTQR